MIALNDYLYAGDTVLKILMRYSEDLKKSAKEKKNQIDLAHSNYLIQIMELLEHNEFLISQSERIREFYMHMVRQYPNLAFTFKGRIKNQITCFRDLIAYRIVISLPKCKLKGNADRRSQELALLYEIANELPEFLEERGFSAELSGFGAVVQNSDLLQSSVSPYYRDYIVNRRPLGYESLHITFYDNLARCFTEVQLRTKEMDDHAEIGPANHLGYEKRQEAYRNRREEIPKGECIYFDEAYERGMMLQTLELSEIDVNMFSAVNNMLINDGCGLYRGRQILPFEHLSRFQSDM